jgi:hypothetical protein
MTPDDGVLMNISPGAFGNNLGANDGAGHPVNPATGQPTLHDVVNRVTSSGHWLVFADGLRLRHRRAIMQSPIIRLSGFPKAYRRHRTVVGDLEWDVKVYLLSTAPLTMLRAPRVLKRFYDGGRQSTIRYMGQNGQSTYAFDAERHII